MVNEIRQELVNGIIPFWKDLRDDEYGGYYAIWILTLRWTESMKRAVS